jgi:hypothetical protein
MRKAAGLTLASAMFSGFMLAGGDARADDAPTGDPAPTSTAARAGASISPGRRALGVGLALVPGVVVHGPGAWVVGKKGTAGKIAIASGVGLFGTLLGGALIALTGASRRTTGPLAAMTIASIGVFSTSMLADLYAVLAPEGGTGEPLREAPWIDVMVGAYAMSDPVFRHSELVLQRIDMRWRSLRTSVQVEQAPESASRRFRMEEAVRLYGATPGSRSRDGTTVDLEGALTDHGHPRDGFGTTIAELSLKARVDLRRFDGELRGAFVEGLVGTGLMIDRYRVSSTTDANSILLGCFAFGTYLGQPSAAGIHGEASLFYDHRRDGFAGGLQPNGIGAGYLGSVGATARIWLGRTWGIGANTQAGSALIGGLSVHFRAGVL